MRYFEVKVKGELFIHAEDRDKCEEYFQKIVTESGLFNVEVRFHEVEMPMDIKQLFNAYENYEATWIENKECCGQPMTQERAKQYLEYRFECGLCGFLVAVDDNGYVEILRESKNR